MNLGDVKRAWKTYGHLGIAESTWLIAEVERLKRERDEVMARLDEIRRHIATYDRCDSSGMSSGADVALAMIHDVLAFAKGGAT